MRPAGSRVNATRRRLLVSGVSAATSGLAGCAGLLGRGDAVELDDVTVVNRSGQRCSGSILVTAPGGGVALDRWFDLDPDGDGEPFVAYADAIGEPGEYAVTVELDAIAEFEQSDGTESTVAVTDPEAEHVTVVLGGSEEREPIEVAVVETEEELEDTAG